VTTPLLRVEGLRTHYFGFGGSRVVKAVDGVSFKVEAGETFGLVGESGCGKTTTCHSLVRLLASSAKIVGGRIELDGQNLLDLSEREMREVRGRRIASILQDPMASLDPLFSIGNQVAEPAYYHGLLRGKPLYQRVTELLAAVRIPSPEKRLREFPHQMSGGMRQRIVGAIAQAGAPRLIIADEPTTNLDVTIQLQYLNLLKELQQATKVALIFVTHNLGIVAKMCDTVAVMYAGKIVEMQPVRDLFYNPRHPYTKALLDSIPKLGTKEPLYAVPGQPPDLSALPPGCSFHPRCAQAIERCRVEEPQDYSNGGGVTRCWLSEQPHGVKPTELQEAANA
jgi:oligopeptide/dipeptide ABC transporter ATP-binding protein